MKNKKGWFIATVVFLTLQGLGAALVARFGLRGWDMGVLLAGMLLLGAVAAALVFLLLRRRSAPAPRAADDPIDQVLATARKRLAVARPGGANALGKLPLLLVLGPNGSTKTTTVLHSGLDPELLAGDVHRGEGVAPTDPVNLWYTRELVVAEAGGTLIEEPERWGRLIRHLRPSRWSAALMRRAQAPRLAVVCFPCDALLQPGAAQSVPAAARTLRDRLVEMSGQLGVRLPVYVLFTKTDRIPHFEEFVRSFSRDEAQQVLGATLPLADPAASASHAEQESRRLGDALLGIFRSLAQRRLEVLPRETGEPVRGAAYEFPREFRKLADLATHFMVELCRPSQLSVSPFLRGFYFTGVRPVVVSDGAAEAPPNPGAPQIALGATSVFSLQGMQPQRPAASAAPSGSRRVPEWVFLKRVFRDVIAADQVARRVTAGGVRVNAVRRAMLGAAAAFFLLLSAGFTVSYLNNRALARDALAAARGVEVLAASEFDAPSLEVLQRLDALREQTARLGEYERGGRPWRLAWGLYQGTTVHDHLRRLYFDRFERVLWASARTGLVGSLRSLPDSPNETSEYGTIYGSLKAHLITTSHPQESSPEFLTPVLMSHWFHARGLDAERTELARRHFDFYAAELRHGNPYRDNANEALVTQTRGFLFKFADSDQLYQVLLAEAGRAHPPIRFHQLHPGTESLVRNPFEVPGVFTRGGWAAVQGSLDDLDRLFAREVWVVGERTVSATDRARLAQELRTRYVADYIRHWQEFLRAGAVVRGGDIPDIARRLERHSGNQPPLLQMFALAAQHTAVDTTEVAGAFQPLHQVVPPHVTGQLITEENAAYVQSLGGLHDALAQATALSGPARSFAVEQAAGNLEQVRGAIRSIAQRFTIDGPARETGGTVQRLMQEPLTGIDGIIGGLSAAGLNAKGASFCTDFRAVVNKYPFAAAAGAQASVDEVMAAFQPGASMLSAFYEGTLAEVLEQRGRQFGARVGADPQPSAQFVAFFNRATAVSNGLFEAGAAEPRVTFLFRPQATAEVPEITVSMDGRAVTFSRTEAGHQSFTWDATRARGIRITGRINGVETALLEGQGVWGIFQVFQQAAWSGGEGGRQTVQWRVPMLQQPLTAEITFASRIPIFNPAVLSVGCVAQVAR